jgi:hypothetical protein
VRPYLVRLPAWRDGSRLDAWEDDTLGLVVGVLDALVLGLLLPALLYVLELPVAVVRSLVGKSGWVDAASRWPAETRMTWRTTRGRRRRVADEVAKRLADGYDDLTPPDAELVAMSKPPGADDLDA